MYSRSEIKVLLSNDVFEAGLVYYREKKYSVVQHNEKLIECYVFCVQNFLVRVNFFQKNYTCNCLNFRKKNECKHVATILLHLADDIEENELTVGEAGNWKGKISKIFKTLQASNEPLWSFVFGLSIIRNHLKISVKKLYLKKTGGYGRESHFHPDDMLNRVENKLSPEEILLLRSLIIVYMEGKQNFNEVEFSNGVLLENHPLNQLIIDLLPKVICESLEDKVYIDDEYYKIRIDYTNNDEGYEPKLKAYNDFGREYFIQFPTVISPCPLILLNRQRVLKIRNIKDSEALEKLLLLSQFGIPKKEFNTFKTKYLPQINKDTDVGFPADIDFLEELGYPAPRINLYESEGLLKLELVFMYQGELVRFEDTGDIVVSRADGLVRIRRNDQEEEEWKQIMEEHSALFVKNGQFKLKISPFDWLYQEVTKLEKKGIEFYGEDLLEEYRVKRIEPEYNLTLHNSNDWLDLKGGIRYGDVEVSFKQILKDVKKERKYVKLSDGSHGKIPQEWIENMELFSGLVDDTNNDLRINEFHVSVINSIFGDIDYSTLNEKTRRKIAMIQNMKGIDDYPIPSTLNGELREYQKAGYSWMRFLNDYNLGGCLADDMGLGKTIQALALLLEQKRQKIKIASMIIAPTSLIFNWEAESNKFSPDLLIHKHIGTRREYPTQELFDKYDIILTTYGVLRRDVDRFKKIKFNYLVLDESQNIKNPQSQNYKAAQQMMTENRLILTGTPIENNLIELWSQFNFINPGLLGNQTFFKESFVRDIVVHQNKKRIESLKDIINPFILRRTKQQVAKELPEKTETVIYCDMPEDQRGVYDREKAKYRSSLLQKIKTEGIEKSRMKILEALTRLRQICNHPLTVYTDYKGESGKLNTLFTMMEDIVAEKHRVLIFSQYVKMLTIISKQMKEKNINFTYLDGQTKNRQKVVEDFQSDSNISAFLISLKAGGVGLNLTAADYVFIIDPWWNPAVEQQAIDRAYRIGQKKNVFVYKTIAKDSIEEKIVKLQEQKKSLVSDIITTDENIFKRLTTFDFEGLFE